MHRIFGDKNIQQRKLREYNRSSQYAQSSDIRLQYKWQKNTRWVNSLVLNDMLYQVKQYCSLHLSIVDRNKCFRLTTYNEISYCKITEQILLISQSRIFHLPTVIFKTTQVKPKQIYYNNWYEIHSVNKTIVKKAIGSSKPFSTMHCNKHYSQKAATHLKPAFNHLSLLSTNHNNKCFISSVSLISVSLVFSYKNHENLLHLDS